MMRAAGTTCRRHRLRALIVLLWRAGLRISEALALQESDLDPPAARSSSAVVRAASVARSAWTGGPGDSSTHGWRPARAADRRAALRDPRTDRRTALGSLGRASSCTTLR